MASTRLPHPTSAGPKFLSKVVFPAPPLKLPTVMTCPSLINRSLLVGFIIVQVRKVVHTTFYPASAPKSCMYNFLATLGESNDAGRRRWIARRAASRAAGLLVGVW